MMTFEDTPRHREAVHAAGRAYILRGELESVTLHESDDEVWAELDLPALGTSFQSLNRRLTAALVGLAAERITFGDADAIGCDRYSAALECGQIRDALQASPYAMLATNDREADKIARGAQEVIRATASELLASGELTGAEIGEIVEEVRRAECAA